MDDEVFVILEDTPKDTSCHVSFIVLPAIVVVGLVVFVDARFSVSCSWSSAAGLNLDVPSVGVGDLKKNFINKMLDYQSLIFYLNRSLAPFCPN